MQHNALISIVLPVYNEQDNIPLIYTQLDKVFKQLDQYNAEFIFVNDGSTDSSWQKIKVLAHQDTRIKAINFSRNFGHQIALAAGYDIANGNAIISMDTDLQHPPEIIPEMIKQWQTGSDIVYVRNNELIDRFFKKITAKIFYSTLDKISSIKIPHHVQDFRLIDTKVLQVIRSSKECSPFWRGFIAWSGFKATTLQAPFKKRTNGKTAYSISKMLKLAFDGLTGFSLFPLKIAAFVGMFVIITGILMFSYITIDAFFFKVNYPLFKWLVTAIYIFMGVQFLLLWLIGEYIGRIFEQQKGRPLYIVESSLNMSSAKLNRHLQETLYFNGL